MQRCRLGMALSLLAGFLTVLGVGPAQAADISGTITSTLTIFENSRLVGDVTCTVVGAPCIRFGASGIELRLHGFTMTGLANSDLGCSGDRVVNEDGISVDGQSNVRIDGPGLIQRFRNSGINTLNNSTEVKIRSVTVSTNCFAGVSMFDTTNSDVHENVFVRNGNIPNGCGGIELINSHNIRIRLNEISGNGYVGGGLDFGIAILAGSSDNMIEDNSVVGNANGIVIAAVGAPSRNIIRENILIGNPPIQVSNSFPASPGFDIRNLSAGPNTFATNLCATAVNAPCPSIAKFSGHQKHPKQ